MSIPERIRNNLPPSRRARIVASVGILLVLIIGLGSYQYLTRDANPIPQNIRSELTFSPFVLPKNTNDYTVSDYKFSTAENKVQILSYLIYTKDGTAVSLSQYTQPQEFVEIPEYKDRFLTNVINQYETVQTSNGTIYLGRSQLQNNAQLAIMIERGLLVLMKPDKQLEPSQWRNLGDQLEIQKVIN